MGVSPDHLTVEYLLYGAVLALAAVVVYLYKAKERLHKTIDKNLLNHKQEVQLLFEKSLISLGDVKEKIVDTDNSSREDIKKNIFDSTKQLSSEIQRVINN